MSLTVAEFLKTVLSGYFGAEISATNVLVAAIRHCRRRIRKRDSFHPTGQGLVTSFTLYKLAMEGLREKHT